MYPNSSCARIAALVLGCVFCSLHVSTALAGARIRVEPGTKFPVRLERTVGTKDFHKWHSFGDVRTVPGTLMQDITSTDGEIALPVGSRVNLAVLESKRAGRVMGRSSLRLGLYSVATPEGDLVPLDGYPSDLNHHKVDREGTAHGKRGLVKDAAADLTSVATGGGVGFYVAGPLGAALGGGGGLLVAALWTVARRGPDLTVPAGTVLEFVIGRPVSFNGTGDVIENGPALRASTWGRGQAIPPSSDLLELADRLSTDPDGVLEELKDINFKERPPVDRTFAKYLRALARYQKGKEDRETLNLMREAYRESKATPMAPSARAEIARNLVVVMRNADPDWERDPILNDPQVQTALVEGVQ